MGGTTRRTALGLLGGLGAAAVTTSPSAHAAGPAATGRVERASAWSAALGEEISYNVYLPPGYASGRWTTIYLLHGRGDDLDAWTRVAPRLDAMTARGLIPPVVAVMPDAPWSDGGSWYVDSAFTGSPQGQPVETALTHDLVAHVDATYRTRRGREHRFVGGYSMGGAGALRYLLAHPDLFAGGLVLSPAVYDPLPPADSSARDYGAFGQGDVPFVDGIYESLGYQSLMARFDQTFGGRYPVRLFLAVGDDEWANPLPEDARHDLDLETALVHNYAKRVSGIESQLRVLDGGHDWEVWTPGFVEGLPVVLGTATAQTSYHS